MARPKKQKVLPSEITLGRYIFERLKQINVNTIFGIPGDFNLSLLDHIKEVEGLRWAGNTNELNAGYSTDGYSRVNGFGCLVTTFGVGELSAQAAVAGSYAEHVGLIHIVGMPTISAAKHKLLLHHTLGDSRFDVFVDMAKNISWKSVVLDDIATAPKVIDHLIKIGYLKKRPVYLGLPSNFVEEKVDSALLNIPIDLSIPPNDAESEDELIQVILEKLKAAINPVVLVDSCATRFNVRKYVKEFVNITHYPVFTTPMGKSSIDENNERFGGVYVGSLSPPDVREAVESADLVVSVGGLLSDFNTGSFSYDYHTTNVIEFHSNYCKIGKALYDGVKMNYVLEKLDKMLIDIDLEYDPVPLPKSIHDYREVETVKEGPLTQDFLWKKLSYFLKPGDVVVTETGTSSFGIVGTHFPPNTLGISQVLWGSIGFSLPAAVGAAFALEEINPKRRVILFIGDGSLQLTVQAISDLFRWNLKPYLFVLNNKGYTIEKLIHGRHADYNQIQPWDHFEMAKLFHGDADYENLRVSTVNELNDLFADSKFQDNSKCRIIELMLDEFDAPKNLIKQAELSEQINAS